MIRTAETRLYINGKTLRRVTEGGSAENRWKWDKRVKVFQNQEVAAFFEARKTNSVWWSRRNEKLRD